MKACSVFIPLFIALTACAQPPGQQDSFETAVARRVRETPPVLELPKSNAITAGRVSYDGIAIEVVKVDNLAQLVNPAAPASYGFGEQNVLRDPINGRVSGLKIFSLQF